MNTISLDAGLRLDLVAEKRVVVELKTVEVLLPVHKAIFEQYPCGQGDRDGSRDGCLRTGR
jgi:hypothetical protein